MRLAVVAALGSALLAHPALAASAWCREQPTPGPSRSVGSTSRGRVEGAVRLDSSDAARVMPRRHAARCLAWGVERLVRAIERAGRTVRERHPGSPPLAVGDIGRARGGPIRGLSRSHQAGRDADFAFYVLDAAGRPVATPDLVAIGADGRARDRSGRRLDVARTWTFVEALLQDPRIDVRWLFVSWDIRRALLAEGKARGASPQLLARAAAVLHRPSDAPAHDDHFHLRVRCTPGEAAAGCR